MDQASNQLIRETTLPVQNDIMALCSLTKEGNKDELLKLLQDPNLRFTATDYNQNMVLHLVIENEKLTEKEKLEIAEWFLDHGFDPNTKNFLGNTALHLAVARRMKDIIDLLIQHKAKFDLLGMHGNTVTQYFVNNEVQKLYNCFESGKIDSLIWDNTIDESASFVKWLISRGFDFDCKNNQESAVYFAISFNLQHILPVLLKFSKETAYINNSGETSLMKFLYSCKIFPYSEHFKKEYTANIVQILLDKGISVEATDQRKNFAFRIAFEQKVDVNIIQILANHFPRDQNQSSLASVYFYQMMSACYSWCESRIKDYLEILRNLLTKGADINYQDQSSGYTPLYWAVREENLQAVKFLRDNGANFQAKTTDQRNLLYLVVDKSRDKSYQDQNVLMELIGLLLSKGCKVNSVDKNGMPLLNLAASRSFVSVVAKLIEHGGQVNGKSWNMMTPLHQAVLSLIDPEKMVELLLNHGADVNARDIQGATPLHVAAFHAAFCRKYSIPIDKMLNILLARGAHIDILNNDGESALCLASFTDNPLDIEEFLRCGANIDDIPDKYIRPTKFALIRHYIKLKTANLLCSDKYEKVLSSIPNEFKESCLKEIELLKGTFISDCVSIFTYLHMNPDDRCAYVNNEKLLGIVNSSSPEETFPKYSTVILAKFREARTWKALLEPAKLVWLDLTEIYLPDLCLKRIFAYMSNSELVNFIEGEDKKLGREERVDADFSNEQL